MSKSFRAVLSVVFALSATAAGVAESALWRMVGPRRHRRESADRRSWL